MQLVAGGFHPALGPYFQLLSHCMGKMGDEAGAEKIRKTYLKLMVQFKAAEASRMGAPPRSAPGSPGGVGGAKGGKGKKGKK